MDRTKQRASARALWMIAGLVLLIVIGGTGYWFGTSKTPGNGSLPVVSQAEADETHPHAQALKNADGSWKYTNHLIRETSPYLLLHAHNPVDWYPWGPEALERARKEDRPIFLSVGYSTCYWCHVMERQVFSDPEIAKMMNRWFINIKIDREERPDLDEIYMTATQLITGGGGWPNSVFLTPDLKPFFAGTYFPPEDAYGRPGFPRVLEALHEAWETRRSEVEEQAEYLTANIRRIQEGAGASEGGVLERNLADGAIGQLKSRYDDVYGGFGGAPKFPPSQDLELLMAEYERTGEEKLLRTVTHTLDRMSQGGMYDHLGGGFHRYSTDRQWHIPHFEKMLYNQAQLSRAYLHAYKLTGEERFRRVAEDIFRYVAQTMTSPGGGFYSALDSETHGIEGKSYLWTEQEIRDALGKDADLFLEVYALAPMPEGEGRVIYTARSLEESAEALGISEAALLKRLAPMKQTLLNIREQRERPLLDTKILTAWNGLMIDAYAYGYEVLKKKACLDASRKAAEFVLEHLANGRGDLHRTYKDGEVKYAGYQEDYAFLIRGLLGLYRASGETQFLARSAALADRMIARFWDKDAGGFFFTSGTENLIVRTKNPYDSAIPSGNSVAAHVLLILSRETGRTDYLEKARQTMRAFAGPLKNNPGAFKHMALAVHRSLEQDEATGDAPVALLVPKNEKKSTTSVPEEEDPVRAEAFVSTAPLIPGETFQVAVRLKIAKGWHVNANPASLDFLAPTTLDISTDLPVDIHAVDYPPGKTLNPEFAEQPLAVYQDNVTIRATLRLEKSARPGTPGILQFNLTYQVCDDRRCLAPTAVKLPLKVRVAETDEQPKRLHPDIF